MTFGHDEVGDLRPLKTNDETITFLVCLFVLSEQLVLSLKREIHNKLPGYFLFFSFLAEVCERVQLQSTAEQSKLHSK
jgi:hypothetical protein